MMMMATQGDMTTVLGKRSAEQCAHAEGEGAVGQPIDGSVSPKRLRCDSPTPTSPESDGLFVWDGIECDAEDIACRDRIAFAATDDALPVRDLVTVIAEATPYQIELAMLHLFSSPGAFSRMCRALASEPNLPKNLNLEALVYRAAHEDRPRIVATMLYRLCEEDDVAKALLTAVEEDDLVAVKAIETACQSTDNMSDGSHQRLARNALCEAAQAGRVSIVAYLVTVCYHDAIEEALSVCIDAARMSYLARDDDDDEDEDEEDEGRDGGDGGKQDRTKSHAGSTEVGDETPAKTVAVFATLWEHADLCAHDYIATLAPCPIRDYLVNRINEGEPCADSCMSNMPDDSEDEEDEDEEDVSTTDDGGHCNEDKDAHDGR
ncbi:hypothetical protein pneo_cds_54 [Pandoravirus neocaledonia]|uniref:Ankyrin repeat domain containing protein n=1 Tax=Pandoravirus neocaledonia TaxID=2107708 RepID=A0A2U7UB30_9VIRU|nr:hypothetical protein pneo_cds_54 [Pandoravirus neocaledonia]AVK75661.1 hypothetical protein pneo_cds_54 [Pandoravirus neocaledonia]